MERAEKARPKKGPRPPSQRQLRVGEQLRHILAELFQRGEVKDPYFDRNDGGLTVTEVRCSADLRNATAYFVPLGGGDSAEMTEALARVAPGLQKRVGSKLSTKFTPRISFKRDRAFDEATRINGLLNDPRVRRDWDDDDDGDDEQNED